MLGRIAQNPELQAAGKTIGQDLHNAFLKNPETGKAAKKLIQSADKIVPEGLNYLGNLFVGRVGRGAGNLADRAARLPADSMRADMLRAASIAAAQVPAGRVAGHAHQAALGAYDRGRQGLIDLLHRNGVNMRSGNRQTPLPPPTRMQALINSLRLNLGRIGDMGTTLFAPGSPMNVTFG